MSTYLETAITAAIAGGKEIMSVYNSSFEVEHKEDDSPLTQADKNANAVINTFLTETPIPIISEENKQTDYAERKDWTQCWIVDPLDGTKEFIKRNGEFTVNIALVEAGSPVVGVIYVPVFKTLYFTNETGTQAFKAELETEHESVAEIMNLATPLQPQRPNGIVKIVGSRSHLNDDTRAFIAEVEAEQEVEIVSKGSSLKFCLVAEGNAHIYPRYAPTMEWDTAAGQAICQAVGVSVLNAKTQAPMKYNKEHLLNDYFIVQYGG
ncbi:3'(2'),5'-bisphosphate nucleotidase CysQ [Altibacter sp. HG106]|uniref:3'(2'),5'-bisphosphate nucleotidase CysQ n=1 Tax=Altibacter sp. HG106 TaxID=3023937 RepID=UPI002350EE36|nr:3'(2'),5'-bisphosphate nucleotidase CysQ [Altibacter sp. HG106]MDC7995370.1 3'(2'),5'-bisphosphate nucleotidase CysQ [Altibacter sp. HG106]